MKSPPPSRSWLSRLLLQLSGMAVDDALRTKSNRSVAIHALRVRMKKLDALLLLMTIDRKATKLQSVREQIHKIKDGVAGSRDQAVIERVAAKLSPTPLPLLPFAKKTEWSAKRLLQETRELHRRVLALPSPQLGRTTLLRHHLKAYQRTRQCLKKCRQSNCSDDFHRWRKRVKILHFQALALHKLRPPKNLARPMAQLGKTLGREHDLVLVMEHLRPGPTGQKWIKKIQSKLAPLHQKALRYGRKHLRSSTQKLSSKCGIPTP